MKLMSDIMQGGSENVEENASVQYENDLKSTNNIDRANTDKERDADDPGSDSHASSDDDL